MWVSAASRRKEGSDIPGPAVILHWDGTAWRTARKVPAVTLNVLAQVPDTPMVWAAGGFWSGSTEGPEHDYFEVTGRLG
jgi:hypothetical protein